MGRSRGCEHFEIRVGSTLLGESCRKSSRQNRAVGPCSSHIGASDSEALRVGAGEGEGPYRMVGCVTARVTWADPWALATGVVREG